MKAAPSTSRELPDILILHGLSRHLVDDVTSLCDSLGLRAAAVLDLPSQGKRQFVKVRYYIRSCRTRIVIASFDEQYKRGLRARPNLYEELGQCANKSRDTLVLREKRGRRLVELPSNLEGQLVVINFQQDRFHEAYPSLIRELRSRFATGRRTDRSVSETRFLRDFMVEMDLLWDNELDLAWEKIHRQDYEAERDFAIALDRFFQCYHDAFGAIASEAHQSSRLEQVLSEQYSRARVQAVRAWEIIAEGKMRLADDFRRNATGTMLNRSFYEAGHTELRRGKNSQDIPESAIKHFKAAIADLDRFMHQRRVSN